MLLTHMQRFTYSAMGALRWKRDVTEYADVLRNSHSPTTNAQVGRKYIAVPLVCITVAIMWPAAWPLSVAYVLYLQEIVS